MEMEPHEPAGDMGDDSPVSPNEEEMSDGEAHSGAEHDDGFDAIRRHGLPSDHNDVLAKLKMQVREINGREDFESQRNQLNFPINNRAQDGIPFTVPFPFPHPAASFLPPVAPQAQAPSSGSSHSSEGSASSQHTWSFEEQFKQVRQLYEISDDPRRKEFLDDLFSFMQKRGSPINRLPIMAKSVLDLYELYNLVIARGGLVDVINKKLWQEIIKGLHLPSSITSAAFTLRTQYMKYLYPYECETKHLSTPVELQAAIDGNRREGRRSTYGPYDQLARRSPNNQHQMTLVSAAQQQHLARISSVMASGINLHNGAHHPSHPQPLSHPINGGPLPSLVPPDFEARMLEYVKMLKSDLRSTLPNCQGIPSTPNEALTPFDLQQRTNIFNMYNNNQTSPSEPQSEPINLSEPATTPRREPEPDEMPTPKRTGRAVEEQPSKASSPSSSSSSHPSTSTSTHIRINSRGSMFTPRSIYISMEIGDTTYRGMLFAEHESTDDANAPNPNEAH